MSRKSAQGFSLIELMIVVAIIGILSAIAVPKYQDYVVRSKLSEVIANLSDGRTKMEQYYQDNRQYGTGDPTCGATMPSNNYFTYTCVTADTKQSFIITAASAASKGLGAAGDYTYTINQQNAKTTTKYKGAAVTGKNCWLVSGSEC